MGVGVGGGWKNRDLKGKEKKLKKINKEYAITVRRTQPYFTLIINIAGKEYRLTAIE